jgi:hypothetical protein
MDNDMSIEDVRKFAETKAKEYYVNCHHSLYLIKNGCPANISGLSEAQTGFRAYQSIVEIIDGIEPCDPIKSEE